MPPQLCHLQLAAAAPARSSFRPPSSDANAAMLEQVASLGIPVLSQTPPAETLEDLTSMYQSLSAMGAKVQVCEQ